MSLSAMASYANLGGNELWNQARLSCYMANGIRPKNVTVRCTGCDGLGSILPCVDSDPPTDTGYQLPELDPAPWYDPNVPESKNLAGFLITSVTMSSPYARNVTQGVGNGSNLGRLRTVGRTIVVHGFIIGKTCCATAYGLRYLTSVAGEPTCNTDGCGTSSLTFLDCCPSIGGEDDCLTLCNDDGESEVYVRTDGGPTEWQRASDFFRRMNGVGIVSGPDVIACRGTSCGGCGCSAVLEFEMTFATESPYLNSLGEVVFSQNAPAACLQDPDGCDITWILDDSCDGSDPEKLCTGFADCADDPLCPTPALPPTPKRSKVACGCTTPFRSERICANVDSIREWGSSTLITEITAGEKDLRNLVVRVWDNPLGLDCDDDRFTDCSACSTLLVSYVPAGGVLTIDGEQEQITLTCGASTRSAIGNVTDVDGNPFRFPDLTCRPLVVSVQFDCKNSSIDALVEITRVDRDL